MNGIKFHVYRRHGVWCASKRTYRSDGTRIKQDPAFFASTDIANVWRMIDAAIADTTARTVRASAINSRAEGGRYHGADC